MSKRFIENVDNEGSLLIDLIFKPVASDSKLHPEEIQLLLAYAGELLKDLEAEESTTSAKESIACK